MSALVDVGSSILVNQTVAMVMSLAIVTCTQEKRLTPVKLNGSESSTNADGDGSELDPY